MTDREIVSVYWHGAAIGFGSDKGVLLPGRDMHPAIDRRDYSGETHCRKPVAQPARSVESKRLGVVRCWCGCGQLAALQDASRPHAPAYLPGHRRGIGARVRATAGMPGKAPQRLQEQRRNGWT